jgi:tetraacyldisaccharide 4'-kinase
MSLQSWLNDIWYRRAAPPWWLSPLSVVYGAASSFNRLSYSRHWRASRRLSYPIVVVGNLTVGGTGKTPLVCWLAERLSARGFKPGVVTRGYGGSFRGERLVSATDDPALVGDEPILLARRAKVPVAVGADRPAAAQLLIDSGCNLILSDDGLQHHALVRDCEIVVIDAERGFGNGRLLPAGPLREATVRLKHVDAIVINGDEAGATVPDASMPMRLAADHAVALLDGSIKPLSAFAGHTVHAVAAIGNPQRFFAMLRSSGIEVTAHPLPDHAALRAADISFGDNLPVLMTEKDAVKCVQIAGSQHWYVPIEATFEIGDCAALLKIVIEAISRSASDMRT